MSHSFPTRRSSDLRNIVGDIRHHGELAQLSDGAVGRADRGAVNVNAVQIIDADNVEFAKTFDNIGEVLGRDRGAEDLSDRSEEHTSELQPLLRISYAVFCFKKKKQQIQNN